MANGELNPDMRKELKEATTDVLRDTLSGLIHASKVSPSLRSELATAIKAYREEIMTRTIAEQEAQGETAEEIERVYNILDGFITTRKDTGAVDAFLGCHRYIPRVYKRWANYQLKVENRDPVTFALRHHAPICAQVNVSDREQFPELDGVRSVCFMVIPRHPNQPEKRRKIRIVELFPVLDRK